MKSLVYLTLSLSLISSLSMGQTRLGYVDFEQVKRIVPQYKAGQDRIEIKTKQLTDSFRLIYSKFEDMIRSIGHSSRLKDSSYLKEKERILNEFQNRIQCFQENAQSQLKDIKEVIDVDIRNIIIQDLKRFSFDKYVICALDKETILYCATCVDLTNEFISYYKTESWKR